MQQQFERSVASTPESDRKPKKEVDGAAALSRYADEGIPAHEMSGLEMYSIIEHIKCEHGEKGTALETQLLRVKRQYDKKVARRPPRTVR